jgi:hypothetical protein
LKEHEEPGAFKNENRHPQFVTVLSSLFKSPYNFSPEREARESRLLGIAVGFHFAQVNRNHFIDEVVGPFLKYDDNKFYNK